MPLSTGIAKFLQSASGLLGLGTVADGEYLKRSGSNVVGAATGPGGGDVVGAASSTDNAVVRFNGASGTSVQNSTVLVTDAGGVTFPGSTSGTTNVVATAIAGTTTLTLPAATDTLVGKATTDTLTNKTLTTPTIASFTNAGHTHTNAAGGGQFTDAALSAAVGLAKGGTGAVLADPNADRILFWDDSAGTVEWLTVGTNLTVTGTTISASGGGGGGDITGPGTSTDTALPRWSGASGDALTDSVVTVANTTGNITTPGSITTGSGAGGTSNIAMSGTTSGTVNFKVNDAAGTATFILASTSGTHTLADLDSAQTFANKTLTTPTIASFANATHNHTNGAGGGQITDAALSSPVGIAKGGTGAVLVDPNADRILFWDDSAGAFAFLTAGTNLTITGTTINASGGGGSGDVTGPGSSTDNAVMRWDGTGGDAAQDSAVTIADTTGNIATPGTISTGVGGSDAGTVVLTEGTAPAGASANTIQLHAPVDVTTAYDVVLPAASATGFVLGTDASNINTFSFVGSSGTGNVVRVTSATLVTPTLGVASATSINKVAITAPASSATLTIADGKTLTVSNTLTLAGTDSTTMTFPGTSQTVVGLTAVQTLTGKTISLTAAHGTDDTCEGKQITGLNAGATIAQWEAVYLGSSSTWLLADANGSSTYPARGLAVAAYSNTNPAAILVHGTVRNDAWSWTPGGTIYLSGTAGALTQTAPSTSGDKVQAIGFALTADIAFFDFNSTYLTVT